jgi:hypothetical protein
LLNQENNDTAKDTAKDTVNLIKKYPKITLDEFSQKFKKILQNHHSPHQKITRRPNNFSHQLRQNLVFGGEEWLTISKKTFESELINKK